MSMTMAIPSKTNNSLSEKLFSMVRNVSSTFLSGNIFSSQQPIKPAINPFGNFGAVASAQKFSVHNAPVLAEVKNNGSFLSIPEAKERLKELVDNSFKPETFSELVKYLSDRLFNLVTVKSEQGGYVRNILVDTQTKKSISAEKITDKLDHNEVLRLKLVSAIISSGIPILDKNDTTKVINMHGWDHMKNSMMTSGDKIGYIVSNGKPYIGRRFCDYNDTRSLEQIVRVASKSKIRVILPTKDGTLKSERIPGLPVLIAHSSLRADIVDSRFSLSNLSKGFKQTFEENISDHVKIGSKRPNDIHSQHTPNYQKVGLSDMIVNTANNNVEYDDDDFILPTFDFDRKKSNNVSAAENNNFAIQMNENGAIGVYNLDDHVPTSIAVTHLSSGRYPLLDSHGEEIGFSSIDVSGNISHYNANGVVIDYSVNGVTIDHEEEEPTYRGMQMRM